MPCLPPSFLSSVFIVLKEGGAAKLKAVETTGEEIVEMKRFTGELRKSELMSQH